jgi:hypothetical protein
MSEYDLCPGGEVRAGPSFDDETLANTTDTPCQGQLIGDANGIEFRGWKRNGSDSVNGDKWSYSAATAYDGVYYVYNGTADIAGNPGSPGSPWRATVLAESTGTGGGTPDCPHLGGDISVSGNPTISYHDKAQPLLLIAGRDLRMSGNPDNPFEGIIAAHEQVQISGNPTINGSFFVQDECQTPSSLVDGTQVASISGNPTINFSGAEIPIGDTIRTTLWLEI